MPTAADVVNALDQQALASILRAYGEEKHAKKIASAIVQARGLYPITRTQQLASIVAGTLINSKQCLREEKIYIHICVYVCVCINPLMSQRNLSVLEIMQGRILPILLLCQLFLVLQASPLQHLSPTNSFLKYTVVC